MPVANEVDACREEAGVSAAKRMGVDMEGGAEMAKAERLGVEEVELALAGLAEWKLEEGKRIRRSYLFATFPEAIAFVNRVAAEAERVQHHPFIAVDYRRVTLTYTTWHAGGLTRLDFECARVCDELADEGSGNGI